MRLKINLSVAILFSTSLIICAQSHRITKIIGTNLFELDNGQKVEFYGLYIPSEQDTNQALAEIVAGIRQWENDFMFDMSLKFDSIGITNEGVIKVNIYRPRAFSDENLAERLLSMGYAALITDIEENYHAQLIGYQKRAQKDGVGIWEESLVTIKSIDAPILISEESLLESQKIYEQPYLPLLAVSFACFALAWDSISDAGDIQETIDAVKSVSKEIDVSKLESSQTRKTIVGVTCILAGLMTTVFSFEKIEIKTNLQSLSLSYRF